MALKACSGGAPLACRLPGSEGQVFTPGLLPACPRRLWGTAQAFMSAIRMCQPFWVYVLGQALACPQGDPMPRVPHPGSGGQPSSCGGSPIYWWFCHRGTVNVVRGCFCSDAGHHKCFSRVLSLRINLPWSWCPMLFCTVESGLLVSCQGLLHQSSPGSFISRVLGRSLPCFGVRAVLASELRRVVSLSVFWKHLREIGINFPVNPTGSRLFFVGKFFIAYSIHLLLLGHSDFLFPHVFRLGVFLGIYPLVWAAQFAGV